VSERSRATDVLAALIAATAFVAWDLVLVLSTPPRWDPTALGIAGFAFSAWGLGGVFAIVLALGRAEIVRALRERRAGGAIAGAIDGAALWYLAIVRQNPAMIGPRLRVVTLAVALAAGAVTGGLARRRFARTLAIGGLVVALAGIPLLVRNGDGFARLALHAVAIASFASLVSWRAPKSVALVGALAAGIAALSATPILSASPTAREALHRRSVHAHAWMYPIHLAVDRDGDGASNLFGGRDCDPARGSTFPGAHERPGDGRDENCAGGDGRPVPAARRSSAHGVAAGADVLLLSFDSLRWDVLPALGGVRRAMGEAAEMTRAVCPSPKTVTSLGSTLRGRSFREVRWADVPRIRGKVPARDRSPTLAVPLARAGYRVVYVPTHPYVDLPTRVATGFERIGPASWPPRPFVPAPRAVEELRRAFAGPRPVCAWAHFMESHHPYRYGDRKGPDDRRGLAASIRWVDRAVAPLVRDLESRRGRRLVVFAWGDHGEEFGEHGGTLHASTAYAEQARVAMLAAGPGVVPGRWDGPVSTASIPATVLDLVGAEIPASMTEPSLLPLWRGEAPWPAVAVSEVRTTRVGVGYTGERFRLVTDPVHGLESLFDSERDPLEQRDVAKERPEELRRMRRLARSWDERH